MTTNDKANTDRILVAIDIAKHKNDVLVKFADGKTKAFKVANQHGDFMEFCAYLKSLKSLIKIAFEPTGDYHRPIAWRMLQEGHEVYLVSSVTCSRVREGIFNSWDKNDPKDAKVIMHLLEGGIVQHYQDPLASNVNDLQELANTYSVIVFRRTQLLHSLKNHYIQLYFPEIEKYLHSTRSVWFTKTFERFPTPASITVLSEPEFVKIVSPLVGRKVLKTQWISELYETATQSIGLPISLDSEAIAMFRLMLSEYARATEVRDNIESRAHELLEDNQDYKLLRSMPGIGPILALIILAEAGDLRRFNHHRQFLKFCGLDLATYQSGTSKGKTRLSKRGNSRLRMAFWMAATIAIRQTENTFRSKYERYIKDKPLDADLKRKARTAVAAKYARVAYSVVKLGKPYRPYFESALPSGKIPLPRP